MLNKRFTKFLWFPTIFFVLLLCWGIVNGLQSLLTEIAEDEAYYWMYAKFLDWGYFDHPPMIALYIKAGVSLFKGTFGVRFITILSQLLCLLTIWWIIDEEAPSIKKISIFFVIAGSVVMFQVFGFIATPDSPLLLFTALFLAAYKSFLEKEDMRSVFLMSLTMAGLMYSKYHGALIILMIIASHPRLFLSPRFWMSGLLALTFFIPHMVWQYQHEFPTLQYHLFFRSGGLRLRNILSYFPNQLANFNPFFFFLFIFLAIRFRAKDLYERGLFFIVWGFLAVFFLSAFRGHVEPHWTIAACIPMIILVYRKSQLHAGSVKYILRVLLPSIGLLLFARIALVIDFLPIQSDFHGPEEHFRYLGEATGNMPAVFESTYQSPSLFTYYTGKQATTVNALAYRKNQYNIWPIEASFAHQTIVFFPNNIYFKGTPHTLPNGEIEDWMLIDSFIPVQKLEIEFEYSVTQLKIGEITELKLRIFNPYEFAVPLNRSDFPVSIRAILGKDGKVVASIPIQLKQQVYELPPGETLDLDGKFSVPILPSGSYRLGMSVKAGPFPESFHSRFTSIEVVE